MNDLETDDPLQRLLAIMARLRDPETGCPWDREQTFGTIAPHTIEEAYEVADAIAQGDPDELRDELGDLLFQVVFYAQLGREQGLFDFADIARAIGDKMYRRHPHVFGGEQVADATAQTAAWERLKAEERRKKGGGDVPTGQLDGVARALPALVRAQKLQKRAAKVDFDWPSVDGVFAKIEEEMAEIRQAQVSGDSAAMSREVGDLLFSCVNLARHLEVDGETALRAANDRFERRFRAMEQYLNAAGASLSGISDEAWDELWERAKAVEERDVSVGQDGIDPAG